MTTIDNASISKKANIYFDGKCVSHSVLLADGSKQSVGVIFPSSLTFNTGAAEVMEIVGGACRVKLAGADAWNSYGAGQQFSVPANSAFDIETSETLEYVCRFG